MKNPNNLKFSHTPSSSTRELIDALIATHQPIAVFESNQRQYSIIVVEAAQEVRISGHRATIRDLASGGKQKQIIGDPLSFLDEIMRAGQEAPVHDCKDIPFVSGLIGYIGYGLTDAIYGIKKQSQDSLEVPDACLLSPASMIVLNHHDNIAHCLATSEYRLSALKDSLDRACQFEATRRDSQPQTLPKRGVIKDSSIASVCKSTKCSVSRDAYLRMVERAKDFILDGQIFQLVLSRRLETSIDLDAPELFRLLRAQRSSTYQYYLDFGDFQYTGVSPETFLTKNRDLVRLAALAGTRPRGSDSEEDALLEHQLRACPKEKAEHMMLVDLARNDLGRVCVPGTIKVGEIGRVLRFPNVMHMATDICGILEQDKSTADAIRSCFPRGTVSGAPKLRAMELLSRLEVEQRGIYSGAVGFIDRRGNADLAIAIRSALVRNSVAHINAGAGIVLDSDPESEYIETLNKARAVLDLLSDARLQAHENPAQKELALATQKARAQQEVTS